MNSQDSKVPPTCPECHSDMDKTTTLEAVKGSDRIRVDVYACLAHRKYTTVKRKEGQKKQATPEPSTTDHLNLIDGQI